MKKIVYIAGLLLSFSMLAHATEITVMALFKDKAMLVIDGKKRLVKKDKRTPEGVLLITANSEVAVLEVDGKTGKYSLGTHISAAPVELSEKEGFRMHQKSDGHYRPIGSINGYTVKFMVDTGATTIAMNAFQAKRLGLKYKRKGIPVRVGTANGVALGYKLKLNTVKLGNITVRNVETIVLEGGSPSEVLLGMSFLSEVNVETRNKVMILRKKF
ncbi:MAG: TIGR02281 family clan AA aspartic protease [Gammaproteobacteria bacterium]|nr:MAG: TIGR02281 family clan AA aspartic protease [Gammaproteobacteria bacterium]